MSVLINMLVMYFPLKWAEERRNQGQDLFHKEVGRTFSARLGGAAKASRMFKGNTAKNPTGGLFSRPHAKLHDLSLSERPTPRWIITLKAFIHHAEEKCMAQVGMQVAGLIKHSNIYEENYSTTDVNSFIQRIDFLFCPDELALDEKHKPPWFYNTQKSFVKSKSNLVTRFMFRFRPT